MVLLQMNEVYDHFYLTEAICDLVWKLVLSSISKHREMTVLKYFVCYNSPMAEVTPTNFSHGLH